MPAVLPEATGTFGEKPVLTFPESAASAELEVVVLEPGDGDVVVAGDDLVVNYLGQCWGGAIFDNSYDRGTPINFPIGLEAEFTGIVDVTRACSPASTDPSRAAAPPCAATPGRS